MRRLKGVESVVSDQKYVILSKDFTAAILAKNKISGKSVENGRGVYLPVLTRSSAGSTGSA